MGSTRSSPSSWAVARQCGEPDQARSSVQDVLWGRPAAGQVRPGQPRRAGQPRLYCLHCVCNLRAVDLHGHHHLLCWHELEAPACCKHATLGSCSRGQHRRTLRHNRPCSQHNAAAAAERGQQVAAPCIPSSSQPAHPSILSPVKYPGPGGPHRRAGVHHVQAPAVAHSSKHVLAAGVLAAEGAGGGPAHGSQRQRVHLQVVQQLRGLVRCGAAGRRGGGEGDGGRVRMGATSLHM